MTPTPTQIAHEADVLAHRICRTAGIPLTDTEMVRSISSLASEHLSALILSAAAKMVRESGAVAELLKVESQLMNVQPHIAQLPKHQQPFIDSHVDMASEATQKALLSLRSITGEARQ